MSDKTVLWVILAVVGVNLYISYRMATELQAAGDKVKGVLNNPLGILGL